MKIRTLPNGSEEADSSQELTTGLGPACWSLHTRQTIPEEPRFPGLRCTIVTPTLIITAHSSGSTETWDVEEPMYKHILESMSVPKK